MAGMSRRTFLQTSAVLAAASRVGAARTGAGDRINVAIFGCRNRGWQVAQSCHRSERFNVVTLCDCDAAMYDVAVERLKDDLPDPPRFEQDFRRVLDDRNVDAVVVATPDHWHALMTVMALDAGKHVFLEKPASYNINDGKAMLTAAKRYPKLAVVVGTQHRSGRHFRDARQFIAEGGLGKVSFCRTWATFTRPNIPSVPDGDPPETMNYDLWVGPAPYRPFNRERVHYNWHFISQYGTGDNANWGAHWIDSARHLLDLDLPLAVSAHGHKHADDIKELPDTLTTVYAYPGLTMLWEMRTWTAYGAQGKRYGLEIGGEKGSLVIDRGGWQFLPKGGEPVSHGGSAMEIPHVRNFADCITEGAVPATSLDDGHKSAMLCHFGHIAASVNARIEVDADAQTIRGNADASAMLGRAYRSPWTMPDWV